MVRPHSQRVMFFSLTYTRRSSRFSPHSQHVVLYFIPLASPPGSLLPHARGIPLLRLTRRSSIPFTCKPAVRHAPFSKTYTSRTRHASISIFAQKRAVHAARTPAANPPIRTFPLLETSQPRPKIHCAKKFQLFMVRHGFLGAVPGPAHLAPSPLIRRFSAGCPQPFPQKCG